MECPGCGFKLTVDEDTLDAGSFECPECGEVIDFENAAVISPLVPASEVGPLGGGLIELSVNGAVKQTGDLADMIWSVPEVVANLSQYYHLQPGDLIYTGTPEGVGPVKPGDRITGRIDGVGEIALSIGQPD